MPRAHGVDDHAMEVLSLNNASSAASMGEENAIARTFRQLFSVIQHCCGLLFVVAEIEARK